MTNKRRNHQSRNCISLSVLLMTILVVISYLTPVYAMGDEMEEPSPQPTSEITLQIDPVEGENIQEVDDIFDDASIDSSPSLQDIKLNDIKRGGGVARIDSVYFDSLQLAIDTAQNGDTIVLVEDVTENISITNKNITIDLSDKSISGGNNGSTVSINNSTVTIDNGTVKDALVDQYGGGLYIQGNSNVSLNGLTISNNTCLSTRSSVNAYGGGLFAGGGSSVLVKDCVFTDNLASATISRTAAFGGGIYVQNGATVTVNTSEIKNNQCKANGPNSTAWGGGAYADTNSKLIINDSIITGNTANGYYKTKGGALSIGPSGTIEISNCEILDNYAEGRSNVGGVVYAESGTFTMNGGKVHNNKYTDPACKSSGGGVCASEDSSITLSGVSFIDNGFNSVYLDNYGSKVININNCTFNSSSADYQIELEKNITGTIKNSKFNSSHAAVSANGMFSGNMNLTIDNCQFNNNDVGLSDLFYVGMNAKVIFNDCSFSNNIASSNIKDGGIINVSDTNGHAILNNCVVENNNLVNPSTILVQGKMELNNSKIQNNTATEVGGIRVYGGVLDITDSVIKNNIARGVTDRSTTTQGGSAGGISIVKFSRTPATVNFHSGAIYDNELQSTYASERKANDVFVQGKSSVYQASVLNVDIDAKDMVDGSVDFSLKKWKDEDGSLFEDRPRTTVDEHRFYTIMNEYDGYVAQINDKKYKTIQEAVDDATSNDIIYIISEETNVDSDSIVVNKPLTIDFQGRNVRLTRSSLSDEIFTLNDNADVTLLNSTTNQYKGGGFSKGNVQIENGAKLLIQDSLQMTETKHDGSQLFIEKPLTNDFVVSLKENNHIILGDEWKQQDTKTITVNLSPSVLNEINSGALTDDVVIVENADNSLITSVIVKSITNKMIAKRIINNNLVLHLDKGVFIATEGDDGNSGTTSSDPVKTFERALEIYNSGDYDGIYFVGSVEISSEEVWSSNDANKAIPMYRYLGFDGNLIVVKDNGKLTLNNIIIDGQKDQLDSGTDSMILINRLGQLTIDSALTEIRNNNAANPNGNDQTIQGGGIYSMGTLIMKDGVIHNNTAAYGGGIAHGYGTFNMEGGVIRDNETIGVYGPNITRASTDTGVFNGGGVFLTEGGIMNMYGDALITHNKSYSHGGGISLGNRFVAMSTGGVKLNMFADTDNRVPQITHNNGDKGGGIYMECYTSANISAGDIMYNIARNAYGPAGGGIYTNGDHGNNTISAVLELKNVEMTGNKSRDEGSAVRTCITSTAHIRDIQGAIIHDNIGSVEVMLASDTVTTGGQVFPVRFSDTVLSQYAPGGVRHNWTSAVNGDTEFTNNWHQFEKLDWFNPETGEEYKDVALFNQYQVLPLNPNFEGRDEELQKAISLTKVHINYNETPNGGGGALGNNGIVSIGSYMERIDIKVEKKWEGDSVSDRPNSVTLVLNRDGVKYDELVLNVDASGNWPIAVFESLPKYKLNPDGSQSNEPHVYEVVEKIGSQKYTSSIAKSSDVTTRYIYSEDKEIRKIPGNKTYQTRRIFAPSGVYFSTPEEAGMVFMNFETTLYGMPVNSEKYILTNTYIKPVIVDPPVKKVVEGTNRKDLFTYTFKPVSNDAGIEVADMPMPAGSSNGTKQVTYNGAGEYEFGEFEISLPGTYTYVITEENTGIAGYTYDTSTYNVIYEVTSTEGVLSAKTTIQKNGTTEETVVFTNKYKEPVKPVVPTPTPKPTVPNTSDQNNLSIWLALMGVSLLTLLISIRYQIKYK